MRTTDQHVGPPEPLPLTFTLDGTNYTLPELDTRTILHALVHDPPGCWWNLIPLRVDGGDQLYRRMLSDTDSLDIDQVEHVAETVLGRLLGMDFHAGRRLAASAYANWLVFDGWCASVGFDPLNQPPGRVLAACYTWRRSMCSKERDLHRLDSDIWQPPPMLTASGAPRDPTPAGWTDTTEADAFAAAKRAFGD